VLYAARMQPEPPRKLRVAILGSGNIGTDLAIKAARSPWIDRVVVLGRNRESPGMRHAAALGLAVSDEGITFIERDPGCCDVVFDATNAADHARHAPLLQRLAKFTIDLTPARVGPMCVPVVNVGDCLGAGNVNMVTCGGQAAIPVAHALGRSHRDIEYLEVVSTIAARSAGPATRRNLDEYLRTTAEGVRRFSGARRAKAILNVNPAEPCVDMQTTVMARVERPDVERFAADLEEVVARVRRYVPGYEIILGPTVENERLMVMVRVRGLGDYLPPYAGNLDIINCAALVTAESYAQRHEEVVQ
jgi:acetaldehyde dehydrogenase (acetylating)